MIHSSSVSNAKEEALDFTVVKLEGEYKGLSDKLSNIAILTYQNTTDIEKLKKTK